jgi:hypothetical protein
MNTKLLLSASAVVMGAAGIAGTFAPQELAGAFGIASEGTIVLLVQLLAAAWLAFAMTNWTARGSLMGGIYNRPGALGNLTHFVVGALALGKVAASGKGGIPILLAAGVYAAFAIAFAMVFFRSPVGRESA